MYTIGDLSQQTGVVRETIRYYEKIGLLPPSQRAENGYRVYTNEDVDRLKFIRQARGLGFETQEIATILAFRDREEPPCQHVLELMQQQIHNIQAQIQDLQSLQKELEALYTAGRALPEDVQMKACVCNLIREGFGDTEIKQHD